MIFYISRIYYDDDINLEIHNYYHNSLNNSYNSNFSL